MRRGGCRLRAPQWREVLHRQSGPGREQGGETERLSLSFFLSYPPPRELNPNTPEALERIVYKSLIVPEYGLAELEADLVDFLRKD